MSEISQLVTDTLDRILKDGVDSGVRDRAEQGEFPAALWATLTDAGLTTASVPEALGGAGLPLAEALGLLRLIGVHAAPLPLAEHLVAARVLAEAGLALPTGPATLALGGASFSVSGGRAHGEIGHVAWAGVAETILLVGSNGQAAVLRPTDATIVPTTSISGEPADTLRLAGSPVTEISLGAWTQDALLTMLAATRAVMAAGAMSAVLATSIDYVQTRKQFGKPISGFQAVQHALAVLAGECAAAQRMADAALEAHGTGAFATAAAAAKARTGEAAGIVAALAHQAHAAMGFTHEHHLHHYTRRLWAWRDEYGNEAFWQRRLGEAVCRGGADNVWAFITASGAAEW